MKEQDEKQGLDYLPNDFLFYGSLRKGCYNFDRIIKNTKEHECSGKHTLTGYKMVSFGSFPAAIKTGKQTDSIVVEAWKVTDERACRTIHLMEIGAGYSVENVTIDGKTYCLYVHQDNDYMKRLQTVPGGDWLLHTTGKKDL